MKTIILFFTLLLSAPLVAGTWSIHRDLSVEGKMIRTGILLPSGPIKQYVIYLQGLGDSFLNHDPFFDLLSNHGIAVVSFDYLGQGGSQGSMDDTTIKGINQILERVWAKYVPKTQERKTLIGWSTGGLAAYRYAYTFPEKTQAMILIAPGIAPKLLVGESDLREGKLLTITQASLTRHLFLSQPDPHVDPIRPNSPLKVPRFSLNLLTTAQHSQKWKLDPRISGLVFLSDDQDTYVYRKKTLKVLTRNASHFEVVDYQGTGALHELDNEIPEVSRHLHRKALRFILDL